MACFLPSRCLNANLGLSNAKRKHLSVFPPHLSYPLFSPISENTGSKSYCNYQADLREVTFRGHTSIELKRYGMKQEIQCTLHIPSHIRKIMSMHHVLKKTFINKSISKPEIRGHFVPNSTHRRNHPSTPLINI